MSFPIFSSKLSPRYRLSECFVSVMILIVILVLVQVFATTDAKRDAEDTPLQHTVHLTRSAVGRATHIDGKRQSDSGNTTSCTPDSDELSRRLTVTLCDAEYIKALMEAEGRECDYFRIGLLFVNRFRNCGTDGNGTLCALHRPFQRGQDIGDTASDVRRECFEKFSLSNCSSGCRDALEEFSTRYGCCIHSTAIADSDKYVITLAPQLWSSCHLPRPEPCPDTPHFPDPRKEVACSFVCVITQYLALDCKYHVRKQAAIYNECGDHKRAVEIEQRCGLNKKGDFCAISSLQSDKKEVLTIYNKCYRFFTTNITCTSECKEALESFKQEYGCCLNNLNSTRFSSESDIGVQVTRSDLWSTCQVATPRFCVFPGDISLYDSLIGCPVCNASTAGTTMKH